MKTAIILSVILLTGCAATRDWLGVNDGPYKATTGTVSSGWNSRTQNIITPKGSYLVIEQGTTTAVIQYAK